MTRPASRGGAALTPALAGAAAAGCRWSATRGARPACRGSVVSAARGTEQAPEEVYAFLADLENHRRLGDRYLRVESLDADGRGGRIGVRTPLGLRRTARAVVTTTLAPSVFGGTALVGRHTRAAVNWRVEPRGRGARVVLEARVLTAGALDRMLLAAGGRRWLRRRFRRVLDGLALALERRARVEVLP